MKITKHTILCSHNNADWYKRELAYREKNYLRAKQAFETLSEDDNNDVLTLEQKMYLAKADYEQFKSNANKYTDVNCGKHVNKRRVSASTIRATDANIDITTQLYVHSLMGDVQDALVNDIDYIDFELKYDGLYVTVTYMSTKLDFIFELSELTMLWDSIDEDTAYIVNTIRQRLDTI